MRPWMVMVLAVLIPASAVSAMALDGNIYDPGPLKPVDSILKVGPGDPAPEFTLPAVSGRTVSLGDFRGKKNVVISFVPAAWTPVCSDQWPGYNIVKPMFDDSDAVLLGVTVDNIPTLFAWTRQMGDLWFEILSDFWPHGQVADRFGLLRGDGTAERALVFIDKAGRITGIHVENINQRPKLEVIARELERMKQP